MAIRQQMLFGRDERGEYRVLFMYAPMLLLLLLLCCCCHVLTCHRRRLPSLEMSCKKGRQNVVVDVINVGVDVINVDVDVLMSPF